MKKYNVYQRPCAASKVRRDPALQAQINRINGLFRANGLTQQKVADLIGCTKGVVCNTLAQRANGPKAEKIRKFIKTLKFPEN